MVRPTSVDRPDGVELDEIRDGERDGMLYEYVRFAVIDWDAGEQFAEELRDECDEWEIGVGADDETMMIELFRELNSVEGPPADSPEAEAHREAEAEYYKGAYEAQMEYQDG